MLANIENVENRYVVQFTRTFQTSIEDVWAALTKNDQLHKWMKNLEMVDLKKGGFIKFNYNDGSENSEEIKITDYEQLSVLEFEWGQDFVRFELQPKEEGCFLLLKEFVTELTDHTPKDVAGWHICLDLLNSLLDGQLKEFSMEEWEKRYEQYQTLVKEIK